MSVIHVFDRQGKRLGEFAQDAQREWMTNEAGGCEIRVSLKGQLSRLGAARLAKMTQFFNLVYIPHDHLPGWCGVILEHGSGNEILTIRCLSAEQLLSFAVPERAETIKGSSGAIWRRMIEIVNSQLDYNLEPGEVWEGGSQREETVEMVDILSEAQRVADRAACQFEVVGMVDGSRLRLIANWYKDRGARAGRLVEGVNIALPSGEIIRRSVAKMANRVTAVGNGGTNKSRPTYRIEDEASAARWGRLWWCEVYDNVSQTGTLERHARELLAERARPETLLRLNALDVNDTFSWLRLGNVADVRLIWNGITDDGAIGYSGLFRIQAMRYREGSDQIELVLEETWTE